MKDRITYLLPEGQAGVDPATLEVTEESFKLPGVYAAKEWRITLAADQFAPGIKRLLDQCHELHLRWAASKSHEAIPPLYARVPPGLHLFFTPLPTTTTLFKRLCSDLQRVFGDELRCSDEPYTQPQMLSERFASSSAYQYYHQLSDLTHLTEYFLKRLYCPEGSVDCVERVSSLGRASLLEFDYDAISQSVVVTATWAPERHAETIRKRSPDDRIEIGILNKETSKDIEEISLGGFLTVLGDDDRPKPTLFSFPSRHHQTPSSGSGPLTFNTTFRQPTGLHPTLQIDLAKYELEPPHPSCALHAYLTLPSALFIDRYQFSDTLFLHSQNLESLRSLSGETDLEAPDWVIKRWGSAALFELLTPVDLASEVNPRVDERWTVSIPLHLRYLAPKSEHAGSADGKAGKQTVSMPYPAVFWACPAESGLKMSVNPFDRVNLGYDGLFGPKTMFWYITPAEPHNVAGASGSSGQLSVSLDVPVLDLGQTEYVEAGTGIAVLLGFLWICWKLVAGSRQNPPAEAVKVKKKE